ncbi:hypothetical protein HXX76_014993 [Chlamydomonas incerta]|uniref:Uncharacterized protein n=1 Tax=Chlamydomonas incerta TaxID=51695 RepID=A0A835SAQ8_CHLIN|nr:hypothetical protein HXX76_014993 [Chlamydomonas incerta]|eukprot:KAG2423833.1 hypothetical protein HXX76_014993 [Chlamydomonas incerta]
MLRSAARFQVLSTALHYSTNTFTLDDLIKFKDQEVAKALAYKDRDVEKVLAVKDQEIARVIGDRDRIRTEVRELRSVQGLLNQALLTTQNKVHVRGAVELASAIFKDTLHLKGERGVQSTLNAALEQKPELRTCIRNVSMKNGSREELVVKALGNLYNTLSKHAHEGQPAPTISLSMYARVDAIAIACILSVCEVRFIVTDEVGADVTASFVSGA